MGKLNSKCGLELLHALPMSVSVTVCERTLKLDEVLKWVPGTMITFEVLATSRLTLRIGEREIGEGQAVKVGSKLGLRLLRVGT